jgi:ParB family chromosome partitioning protein
MNALVQKAEKLLTVPADFVEKALAFPANVEKALALVSDTRVVEDFLHRADAMARLAKRIKADTKIVNSIQHGKLKIVARWAELNPAKSREETGKLGGRGRKGTVPGTAPFSSHTEAKFRKVGDHEPEIDPYVKAADAGLEAEDGQVVPIEVSIDGLIRFVNADGIIATKHGGGVVDWFTPEKYIVLVREVMGGIDLDPASADESQVIIKAKTFYTKEDDGLKQEWSGRVFLNPPFKMPEVEQFIFKLCDTIESNTVTQAILLTNDNTDTKWWQRAAGLAEAVCFSAGRIGFYNRAGQTSQPTNGQTFCYFGAQASEFRKVFAEVGLCLRR